jgi:hypothetical protein
MPEDVRSKEMLLQLGIPAERIVPIKNPPKKGEIDNFLVRFERTREQYAGYGIDIYYDLGEEKKLNERDNLP